MGFAENCFSPVFICRFMGGRAIGWKNRAARKSNMQYFRTVTFPTALSVRRLYNYVYEKYEWFFFLWSMPATAELHFDSAFWLGLQFFRVMHLRCWLDAKKLRSILPSGAFFELSFEFGNIKIGTKKYAFSTKFKVLFVTLSYYK